MTIEAIRTPEERFEGLPGFPWAARYEEDLPGLEGLRVAMVDEGPADADHTFLCLHGQPTWSYLYRKMIPGFLQSGARVIAPDFLGFGRSDKPVADADYTVDLHRRTVLGLLDRLDLSGITLVCQDWGGLIGLTLPLDSPPGRFSRLLVMNTMFPIGRGTSEAFEQWKAWVAARPDLQVGRLMARAVPGLSEAEAAAYDAPFPDVTYKAGVRRFPMLVPTDPDDPVSELGRRARTWWSSEFDGPSFMAVGAQDPLLGPAVMGWMKEQIRGCPEPLLLDDVGHFVQEAGEPVVRAALATLG